jgi:hypothetical protein
MISHLDKKRQKLLRDMFDSPEEDFAALDDAFAFSREVHHLDIPAYCRREVEITEWERYYE